MREVFEQLQWSWRKNLGDDIADRMEHDKLGILLRKRRRCFFPIPRIEIPIDIFSTIHPRALGVDELVKIDFVEGRQSLQKVEAIDFDNLRLRDCSFSLGVKYRSGRIMSFRKTKMERVSFDYSKFVWEPGSLDSSQNAWMKSASLSRVSFYGCVLRFADFRGCTGLTASNFEGAKLIGCRFDDKVDLNELRESAFQADFGIQKRVGD